MAQIPTISDSLAALFSAFPASDRGDNVQAIRAYLLAVEDIPPRFVALAVRRYIRGEVVRERHTFCPVAPELAIEARRLERQAQVEAQLASRKPLPKPPEREPIVLTAEERKERVRALEDLIKTLPTGARHTRNSRGGTSAEELRAMDEAEGKSRYDGLAFSDELSRALRAGESPMVSE